MRISSLEVRSPRTAFIESIMIDLPAPVSPVRTFSPLSNSSSALSITAIFSIFRPVSIAEYLYSQAMISSMAFFIFAANSGVLQRAKMVSSPARVPTSPSQCMASRAAQAALAMPV